MPDTRNKIQGQQGEMGEGQQGGTHHAPGRNPQDDQSAGGQQQGGRDRERGDEGGQGGGSNKEGGQNEQTRR